MIEQYKDYKIDHAPDYTRHLYQYVHNDYDGPEDNRIGVCNSIEECKNEIDSIYNEQRNELLEKAYLASDYNYSDDDIVVTDRYLGLDRLSNDELLELIQKAKKQQKR